MKTSSTLSLPAALLLALPLAAQTTYYVDVAGTPPGTGTPADPFVSIQLAIDTSAAAAGVGDTIEVAPGVYVEDLDFGIWDPTVRGTEGAAVTILSSDGAGGAAVFMDGSVPVLEGFTVTGVLDARPAVFIDDGARGILRRCVIRGNAGVGVTGVYDAEIRECTIIENAGAGVVTAPGLNAWTITNTIISGNGQPSSFTANFGCIEYCILADNTGVFECVAGTNLVAIDPQLWGAGAPRPKPGSPAIDAGDPGSPLDPDGSPIDIGAYTFAAQFAPAVPETYCTSRVNSQGCSPVVSVTGSPSLSGTPFTIDCGMVLNNKTGLFFYGYTAKASAFQGGYLCVAAPVRRTSIQNAGGNPPPDDCSGTYSFDFGALIQSGSDPALLAGQPVFGQFWYRDAQQAGPFSTGRSEGIAFVITP